MDVFISLQVEALRNACMHAFDLNDTASTRHLDGGCLGQKTVYLTHDNHAIRLDATYYSCFCEI